MSTTFKMFLKHGRFRSDLKEEVWLVKPKLDLLRTYKVFSEFKNVQGWEWFWKRVEDFSDQSALVIRDRAHTSTPLPGTDFNSSGTTLPKSYVELHMEARVITLTMVRAG